MGALSKRASTAIRLSVTYFLLLTSLGAYGFEDMLVHQHQLAISGTLPAPHYSIELEIALDPETDDAKIFRVAIGGTPKTLSEANLAKLRDLELGTLRVTHGMHRTPDSPATPIADYLKDYIVIRIELGKRYRIEYQRDGKTRYHWGRDTVEITLQVGEDTGVVILPLAEPY